MSRISQDDGQAHGSCPGNTIARMPVGACNDSRRRGGRRAGDAEVSSALLASAPASRRRRPAWVRRRSALGFTVSAVHAGVHGRVHVEEDVALRGGLDLATPPRARRRHGGGEGLLPGALGLPAPAPGPGADRFRRRRGRLSGTLAPLPALCDLCGNQPVRQHRVDGVGRRGDFHTGQNGLRDGLGTGGGGGGAAADRLCQTAEQPEAIATRLRGTPAAPARWRSPRLPPQPTARLITTMPDGRRTPRELGVLRGLLLLVELLVSMIETCLPTGSLYSD